MEYFLNGFTLFFDPMAAKSMYFPTQNIGYFQHFQNALGYLTKAYYVEKNKIDSAKAEGQ